MFKKYLDRIEKLEKGLDTVKKDIGGYEEKKEPVMNHLSFYEAALLSWTRNYNKSIKDEIKQLRDDFEELDNKFDHLERYLQIEFFKKDEKTQTYDWADSNHTEGYRKTKPYEVIKKQKEQPERDNNDYDDED